MRYFEIQTIKTSIEELQKYSANWLIPAFVFAANDVGQEDLVDMSRNKGTDQFLDYFFNGRLIGIPSYPTGNNLLRPRMKGITWIRGKFANDYMIRQDTKMWGNLFSSRGYREMRQRGEVEGEKATVRLTDAFQSAFERQIPAEFKFEDFMVWLFAFSGFPNHITSWQGLYEYLLRDKFELHAFKAPYIGRFKLEPDRAWPRTLSVRPTNNQFLSELAPRLEEFLKDQQQTITDATSEKKELLSPDDPILSVVRSAIAKDISRSFLLAGPPGTGKTKWAHNIAAFLTDGEEVRVLSLQFHPAFGYDDFVEGFRPAVSKGVNGTGVTYVLENRHFLKFAEKAKKDPDKLYVLVIDELNRGDVARIFGELLTYLELDYRDTEFTLAISGKRTTLPRNLIVLATANPFDRSITDLDDALLRRFVVIMMEPDKAFLESYLKDRGVETRVLSRTLRIFDILTDAFPAGFGHTSFLKVESIDDLADVWKGRVQLGLQRAFFHDGQRYEAIKSEIEHLLQIDEEAEAADTDDA